MLTMELLESRLVALGEHRHDGSAKQAFAARLNQLLPQRSISINWFAANERKMVNQGGEPFDYDPDLTPYDVSINEACDDPGVRVIAVKGCVRSGKTVAAENMVLRDWMYGPSRNVLWFMQDEDSINDYIDERGEEMLRIHDEINEKINWADRRNSRKRKMIGKALVLYRPATMRALRAKAAPIIVADEIDAYNKKIRRAIMTLITSRQGEFGTAAKAYLCSHADAGPDDGIDSVLKDSLLHLWFAKCPHCGNAASPALEAEEANLPRWTWNVPEMMSWAEEMDRLAFLEFIADNVHLKCPAEGCGKFVSVEQARPMMRAGRWLQPHQVWNADGTVTGEERVSPTMGFVIHAFQAPFVDIYEVSRDFASAQLDFDMTGDDTKLREVVVKKLGETLNSTKPEEKIESWKVVQARLSAPYQLGTVPDEVMFLTAFVDIQGDRFAVRVIGWDLMMQSWLIDLYDIKQWPAIGKNRAFANIDPGRRLGDWDVLEEAVIAASYPLASNPHRKAAGMEELFLPIARTAVNSAGQPGATDNARQWAANLLSRSPKPGQRVVASWQIMLFQGNASKTAQPMYGKAKAQEFDDKGKPLATTVFERYPNVHEIKRVLAVRMKIEEPGPGKMNLPAGTDQRVWMELCSERMVNGDWTKIHRYNELWDGWVACDTVRDSLDIYREALKDLWAGPRPIWARPLPRGQEIGSMLSPPTSPFDRLLQVNQGT